jgi:hypothetical protein
VWSPPVLQGGSTDRLRQARRFYLTCIRLLAGTCATGPVCSSKSSVHIGSESITLEPLGLGLVFPTLKIEVLAA